MNTPVLTAWSLLIHLSRVHHTFYSTERANTPVSNSELKRWIQKGSLEINGYADTDPKEIIDYPVMSIVIHPKSPKRRITIK